jgi:hypothetical protein
MMKHIFLALALISFFSCEVKKDNIEQLNYDNYSAIGFVVGNEYKIKQENFDDFYSIKLVDRNDFEILWINFNNDGSIISYHITDNNFSSLVNLVEDGIFSYSISDGNKYANVTHYRVYADELFENNELFLYREEQVEEDTAYIERIYKNGFVTKEKMTEK